MNSFKTSKLRRC